MYAFIHIPKTAGSTVRRVLRASFGPRHCDLRPPLHKRTAHEWLEGVDLRRVRKIYPSLAGICGHRVTCFTDLGDEEPRLRFFTFLRHPYRRFASNFFHCMRRRLDQCTARDFQRFCALPMRRNVQTQWLGGSEDPDDAIAAMESNIEFVGLTERFDESFVMMAQWLNHPDLHYTYEACNRCRGRPALPIFEDPDLRAMMEKANAADMKVYQYAVHTLYPRQQAAYGPALSEDVERFRRQLPHRPLAKEPSWARTKRNLIYKPLLHLSLA